LKRGGQLSEKFRDHAWFVAFAPDEKPEIALAVLVEHGGHGGVAAAPIAKTAIEAYMKPKLSLDRQTPQ
jgi:penicillin-binding protein 2